MNYKDYEKISLGCSDMANLTIRFCNEEGIQYINIGMGSDGCYYAYLVDDNAEIGAHYSQTHELVGTWFDIIDDSSVVFKGKCKVLKVHQAGDFGIILQIFK